MENSVVSAGKVKSIVEKMENHPDVAKVLMLSLAGSHAYGTNNEGSDIDIRGVFVATPNVIRTPFKTVTELNIPGEEDAKIYELGTFLQLFSKMNPNIIELGFTDSNATLYEHEAWKDMKENFFSLLSSEVAFRFSGYAMAQLKRIKGHNKHINNPQPKEPPTQFDYFRLVQSYLGEGELKYEDFVRKLKNMEGFCTLVPYGGNIYGVVEDRSENVQPMFNKDGSIRKLDYEEIPEEVKRGKTLMIVKYCADDHKWAKERHHNYWEWVKNRNEKRHELEEKFGYDTKHAMHLVRLLRMGEEILMEGKVLVNRPDAEELLAIRNGEYRYEEIVEWAEEKDKMITSVLYKQTSLPKKTDLKIVEKLILEAQDKVWKDL